MLKSVSSVANAIGALNYKGTWNANTNNPALASGVGTKGDYYVVGTAGSTNLDGISNWGIGDWAVFNGSVWQRVEGGADLNGVNLSVSGTTTLSGLTASTALALDASKNVVSVTNTGTGNNVLASGPSITSPTFATDTTHSYLTASAAVATDANKKLVSVTNTGTGNNVLATSPSIATPTLTGDVSMTTGNLVVGTSGKGVDFSVTPSGAGTMTSELLDDYEVGTWTPVLSDGTNTSSLGTDSGWYIKVGKQVVVGFAAYNLNVSGLSATTEPLRITGVPFTNGSKAAYNAAALPLNLTGENIFLVIGNAATQIFINRATGTVDATNLTRAGAGSPNNMSLYGQITFNT